MAATQEKQTDRWLKNLFEHNSFNYGFAFYCAMTPYYYLITATQLSEEPPRNVMRKTWQTLGISGFYRGFQMSWLAFGLRYCAPFGNRDFENMKQDIYPDKLRSKERASHSVRLIHLLFSFNNKISCYSPHSIHFFSLYTIYESNALMKLSKVVPKMKLPEDLKASLLDFPALLRTTNRLKKRTGNIWVFIEDHFLLH